MVSSRMPRATQHGFDGGVDRLDDAKTDVVIAVGGDPVEMLEQELAQPLHLGETLPPERVAPAVEEVQHTGAGLCTCRAGRVVRGARTP